MQTIAPESDEITVPRATLELYRNSVLILTGQVRDLSSDLIIPVEKADRWAKANESLDDLEDVALEMGGILGIEQEEDELGEVG